MVRLLLKAGADVNAQDKLGALFAIISSVRLGYVGVIHRRDAWYLCVSRRPLVVAVCTGSTPLHRACSAGKVGAARALVEEGGAKLEMRDRQGQTPLLVAASCGHQSVALYLIARGADITVRTVC